MSIGGLQLALVLVLGIRCQIATALAACFYSIGSPAVQLKALYRTSDEHGAGFGDNTVTVCI